MTARTLHDGDTFTYKGLTFRAHLKRDDDHPPPWEDGDGRGIVTDWMLPEDVEDDDDYRELSRDTYGRRRRYFDWTATKAKALAEEWDAEPYGGTPDEKAERATDAEYRRIKAWCNDEWEYIGVMVELLDEDGAPTGWESGGLWGIESDAGAYLREVAEEQAEDLLDEIPEKLAGAREKLAAMHRLVEAAQAKE